MNEKLLTQRCMKMSSITIKESVCAGVFSFVSTKLAKKRPKRLQNGMILPWATDEDMGKVVLAMKVKKASQ